MPDAAPAIAAVLKMVLSIRAMLRRFPVPGNRGLAASARDPILSATAIDPSAQAA
jgi:hypothetical protein